jgi:hypothetical protein
MNPIETEEDILSESSSEISDFEIDNKRNKKSVYDEDDDEDADYEEEQSNDEEDEDEDEEAEAEEKTMNQIFGETNVMVDEDDEDDDEEDDDEEDENYLKKLKNLIRKKYWKNIIQN